MYNMFSEINVVIFFIYSFVFLFRRLLIAVGSVIITIQRSKLIKSGKMCSGVKSVRETGVV